MNTRKAQTLEWKPNALPRLPNAPPRLLIMLTTAMLICVPFGCGVRADHGDQHETRTLESVMRQDQFGNLHINSTANQTVFLNGADPLQRIHALEDELAALRDQLATAPPQSAGPGTTSGATFSAGFPDSPTSIAITYRGDVVGCSFPGFAASNITRIDGSVRLVSPSYSCRTFALDNLSKIAFISGDLTIKDNNQQLTAIGGFTSLVAIGGSLTIDSNTALAHLNGFSQLTSVGGDVVLHLNPALTNVDGLSALSYIGGRLYIYEHSNLENVDGFSSLTSVGGYLYCWGNLALTNLDGFASLTAVGAYLQLNLNPVLANVNGLANLTSVGAYVAISNNDVLANVDGFSSLTSIDAYLLIHSNNGLTSLDGFSALTTVNGAYIRICLNPQLSTIPPFFTDLSAGKTHGSQCLRAGSGCC